MTEGARTVLSITAPLLAVALVALVPTLRRDPRGANRAARVRAGRLVLVAVAFHVLHAVEEYATGFPEKYPELLGLSPLPPGLFWIANGGLVLLWGWCALGIARGVRIAFLPVWFFVLAQLANAVAHPILAIVAGGYFPGLATSPVVGIVGLWLGVTLWRATASASR